MNSLASRLTHFVTLTLGTLLTTSMYWIRFCWVIMSLQEGRKGQLIVCSCNITGVLFSLLILFLFSFFFTFSCRLKVGNHFKYAFSWSSAKKAKHGGISESMMLTVSLWVWCEYCTSSLCSLCHLMWWCLCRTALCRLSVYKARNICLVVISPYMLYMKWKLCGELNANMFSSIPNYCFLTISIYIYF